MADEAGDHHDHDESPLPSYSAYSASPAQARMTTFFPAGHQSRSPGRDDDADHDAGHRQSDAALMRHHQDDDDNASSAHIRMESPAPRPRLPKRNTFKGSSQKNITEALRAARRREEQETLLADHEEADDDGCYPPRANDDPQVPNPHRGLPVYTNIHKIRRLVIASIGESAVRLHIQTWLG